MKSGSYYLYEYKNNQKSRNVGFLKFAQHPDVYSLQICARGLSVFQNDSASLSALFPFEKQFSAHFLQSVTCENHAITCRLEIPDKTFSESHSLEQISGFLLELPGGSYVAATDDSLCFTPSLLVPSVSASVPEDTPDLVCEDILPSSSETVIETVAKTVIEAVPEPSPVQPKPNLQRLSRSELSVLPRQYWHLANNSFLLHGYYNYNHLLLIEEDGHFLLGVPGVYDKQEARAAELFGFPSFSESYTDHLQLSEEDLNMPVVFGHWFREIPKR